jgi:bifunctional UDP-N-acetylglucosamine pyrophosphorylase / glucosamine-1-phosphate N-acetyltransferase
MREGFVAVVLAAGQGTRMKSALPKVLHPLCGRELVAWPVLAALEAGAARVVVVVGHGREAVESSLALRFPRETADGRVTTAVQEKQLGTGDAVRSALPALADVADTDYVVVLCGDTPLLRGEALTALLRAAGRASDGVRSKCAMLTGVVDDPTGYGRIVRDADGRIASIREHKDASAEERAIREMNPGIYAIEKGFLVRAIGGLDTKNAQGELYLTDVVARAAADDPAGVAGQAWDIEDLHGVNDRVDLARTEALLRARIHRALGVGGVTLRDPQSTYVDADVVIATDVILEPGVVLRGRTEIGAGARIDVGCVLENVVVAAGARLRPYTVAVDSVIGERAQVGPFSHLRPKSTLGADVHIGNFVETKATTLGARSKANHLAYLGDGVIGEDVNVGAGTIFCNYDGAQKHTTRLEDGAFIGSDSQLVAPVTIGRGAYVATGTTVTKDVPADALAIGRIKQENKLGYAPRLRATMKAKKDAALANAKNETSPATAKKDDAP